MGGPVLCCRQALLCLEGRRWPWGGMQLVGTRIWGGTAVPGRVLTAGPARRHPRPCRHPCPTAHPFFPCRTWLQPDLQRALVTCHGTALPACLQAGSCLSAPPARQSRAPAPTEWARPDRHPPREALCTACRSCRPCCCRRRLSPRTAAHTPRTAAAGMLRWQLRRRHRQALPQRPPGSEQGSPRRSAPGQGAGTGEGEGLTIRWLCRRCRRCQRHVWRASGGGNRRKVAELIRHLQRPRRLMLATAGSTMLRWSL